MNLLNIATKAAILDDAACIQKNYCPHLSIEEVINTRLIDDTVNTREDGEVTILGIVESSGRSSCRITGKRIAKGEKAIKIVHSFTDRCGSGFTSSIMYIKF